MHKSAFEDAAELSSPNWVQSSKDDAGAFRGFQASGMKKASCGVYDYWNGSIGHFGLYLAVISF
ncbi:hypothetical protein ES332_D07G210000v1 [Gossypium tomentosum]|uniref:Uncharacterized protein n=1 Tax=Gossypium tomentosum TaxID=34277 RepID=A0A5D2K927_GOSTO|nr:hypothetical protein ES332_D07G210000v1 [Gossypium tomentosum]